MSEEESKLCNDGDHDLEIIDESFDHEFGCEQIYYYRCILCDSTNDEDSRIPAVVDEDN